MIDPLWQRGSERDRRDGAEKGQGVHGEKGVAVRQGGSRKPTTVGVNRMVNATYVNATIALEELCIRRDVFSRRFSS